MYDGAHEASTLFAVGFLRTITAPPGSIRWPGTKLLKDNLYSFTALPESNEIAILYFFKILKRKS
jgi:hypothetical protein